MPAISKIRLTNVVYEQGQKRYHDEIFLFDGHNGAVLLENGGGKRYLSKRFYRPLFHIQTSQNEK